MALRRTREAEREREREKAMRGLQLTAKTRSEKHREPTQPGTTACKHESMAMSRESREY